MSGKRPTPWIWSAWQGRTLSTTPFPASVRMARRSELARGPRLRRAATRLESPVEMVACTARCRQHSEHRLRHVEVHCSRETCTTRHTTNKPAVSDIGPADEASGGGCRPSTYEVHWNRCHADILLMRQIELVLMIGASIAALFILGRIVQECLGR